MPDEHILQVALRVLNASALDMNPDPEDAEKLKKFAVGPESALPPKALAVFVIQQELKARRSQGAAGK